MPAFLAGAALAQPSIAAVQNNYSNIIRGMPNYGIAQGSVFTIFGSNLGPAQTPVLPDLSQGPLATNLKGVTVQVTVNGTTVQAIPYYVSATQIAAILPSRTPVGTGTVTVTFNNVASSQSQITVVPAAFGIDTLNGAGTQAMATRCSAQPRRPIRERRSCCGGAGSGRRKATKRSTRLRKWIRRMPAPCRCISADSS